MNKGAATHAARGLKKTRALLLCAASFSATYAMAQRNPPELITTTGTLFHVEFQRLGRRPEMLGISIQVLAKFRPCNQL